MSTLRDQLSPADTKRGRAQRAVLDLLEQKQAAGLLPTYGRFVFYELEMTGNACKPDPEDKRPNKRRSHGWPPGAQDITDVLTDLRNEGVVPWDWIEDERRHLLIWNHAATVADYMLDRLSEATINPWYPEDPPLILCESGAMAGVLTSVAARYCCPITGTSGQARGFLVTKVAPLLRGNSRRVYYLGDDDRSGRDIEANTRRVLEREAGRSITWLRLGEQEIARVEPIWKVDGRDGRGHWARELEGLGQAEVVRLLRSALEDMAPESLDRVLEREKQERAEIEGKLQ